MMRNPANGLVMVMTLLAASSAAQAQHHLMRFADVHGDRIVFTYENDLWIVSTEGGDARRLTSDPGAETWAKFSPDGQLLAFLRAVRRRNGHLRYGRQWRRAQTTDLPPGP